MSNQYSNREPEYGNRHCERLKDKGMRTTDTIEEFMERIHLPSDAVDEILRFQMTEEELAEWEKRFQNDRDDFFHSWNCEKIRN